MTLATATKRLWILVSREQPRLDFLTALSVHPLFSCLRQGSIFRFPCTSLSFAAPGRGESSGSQFRSGPWLHHLHRFLNRRQRARISCHSITNGKRNDAFSLFPDGASGKLSYSTQPCSLFSLRIWRRERNSGMEERLWENGRAAE